MTETKEIVQWRVSISTNIIPVNLSWAGLSVVVCVSVCACACVSVCVYVSELAVSQSPLCPTVGDTQQNTKGIKYCFLCTLYRLEQNPAQLALADER